MLVSSERLAEPRFTLSTRCVKQGERDVKI